MHTSTVAPLRNATFLLMANAYSAWLTKYRTDKKLSKRALDKETGVSSAMITMLENGTRNPSRDMVVKLASALCKESFTDEEKVKFISEALAAAGFTANTAIIDGPIGTIADIGIGSPVRLVWRDGDTSIPLVLDEQDIRILATLKGIDFPKAK